MTKQMIKKLYQLDTCKDWEKILKSGYIKATAELVGEKIFDESLGKKAEQLTLKGIWALEIDNIKRCWAQKLPQRFKRFQSPLEALLYRKQRILQEPLTPIVPFVAPDIEHCKHFKATESTFTFNDILWKIEPGEYLVIGTNPGAGYVMTSNTVDNIHARLSRVFMKVKDQWNNESERDVFVLEDLNSITGTFLNNKKLTEPTIIKVGDKIKFGQIAPEIIIDADILVVEIPIMPEDKIIVRNNRYIFDNPGKTRDQKYIEFYQSGQLLDLYTENDGINEFIFLHDLNLSRGINIAGSIKSLKLPFYDDYRNSSISFDPQELFNNLFHWY